MLERILRGERLIVCRYGHPVATLQPLTGCVTQPFESATYDIAGSPFGDADRQIAQLRPAEKKLLMDGVARGRFIHGRVRHSDFAEVYRALQTWEVRGLARRTRSGLRPTGLAWFLRERLLEKAGRIDDFYR